MIRSFTGWRYIFAVAIFMHHYQIDGKSVLQAGGAIGVTFFFILSGFLLAYGYKKRLMTREISTSDFYKARAVKLYPVLRRRIFAGYSQFCHGGSAQGGSEPVSFAKLGSVAGLLHVV